MDYYDCYNGNYHIYSNALKTILYSVAIYQVWVKFSDSKELG